MRLGGILGAAALGVLTGLPVLALYYLGAATVGLPFIPFDGFDWLARALPGAVVTRFVEVLVPLTQALAPGAVSDVAKQVEGALALALDLGVAAVLAAGIATHISFGRPWGRWIGLIVGVGLAGVVLAVEAAVGNAGSPLEWVLWSVLPPVAWGGLLGLWLGIFFPPAAANDLSPLVRAGRRAILVKLIAGATSMSLLFWWLGVQAVKRPAPKVGETVPPVLPSTPPPPSGRVEPAPGARPEITSNEAFYKVNIGMDASDLDGAVWRLAVSGLFERPRRLSLADLMAYPAVVAPITLSCISNTVGGELIGNAYWTGLRLRDLLADLGLRPDATELHLESADGFYGSVTLADALDEQTLLVYGMNGAILPAGHGYPLRILIPDRYGMKQPKWILSLEAISEHRPGFWEERDWSEEARPQIMSQVDSPSLGERRGEILTFGGIAWAGARGIRKVELKIDEGPWVETTLRVPALGPLAWTQWRYDWPATPGQHRLRVRATDGSGTPQSAEPRDPQPEGATGYDLRTITV
ncbi:MAG: molybdopterin-dependent oxidoreductase [Chloroflexota bacterium]